MKLIVRSFISILPTLGIGLMLVLAPSGCDRKTTVRAPAVSLQTTHKEVSPFQEAADMLNRLDDYQPELARNQILFKLRQWSREQRPNVDWIADPMFRRIPAALAESAERLESSDFDAFDAYVLTEAVWLRDLAQSICSREIDDPRIMAEFQRLEQKDESEASHESGSDGERGGEGAEKERQQIARQEVDDLKNVYRLFDWTVRNIQLDPELEDQDFLGGEKEKLRRDSKSPRHFYHAWENVLYSHGDWLERSRVVILLARQMGIPVVMLASERNDETRYWCAAALLGKELYLFDTGLGLPLPGKENRLFGKLSDYLDQPGLLNDLTTIDEIPYHFTSTDLDYLTALIDATPAHLSQRMKFVETRLEGKAKMALTIVPSPLASRLRGCRGINSVSILLLPYQGYQFARQMQQLPPQEQIARMGKLAEEQRPFLFRGPVYQGRLLHFRGDFRGDDIKAGATKFYMDARVPQQELKNLDTPYSMVPPNSPILADLPQGPDEVRIIAYERKMESIKRLTIQSKQLVTFWLGLVAMENHDYQVAIDFFERILEQDPNSPWVQGAIYNLARCHEMKGLLENAPEQVAKAIELYQADQVPQQRTGSRLRALRLAPNPHASLDSISR